MSNFTVITSPWYRTAALLLSARSSLGQVQAAQRTGSSRLGSTLGSSLSSNASPSPGTLTFSIFHLGTKRLPITRARSRIFSCLITCSESFGCICVPYFFLTSCAWSSGRCVWLGLAEASLAQQISSTAEHGAVRELSPKLRGVRPQHRPHCPGGHQARSW